MGSGLRRGRKRLGRAVVGASMAGMPKGAKGGGVGERDVERLGFVALIVERVAMRHGIRGGEVLWEKLQEPRLEMNRASVRAIVPLFLPVHPYPPIWLGLGLGLAWARSRKN